MQATIETNHRFLSLLVHYKLDFTLQNFVLLPQATLIPQHLALRMQ